MQIPPRPKRRLGQNFLQDNNVIEKLIRFIQPLTEDCFVEIGAGTGALTSRIAPLVSRIIAVEIDESLLPYLEQIPSVEILQQDIRKLELRNIVQARKIRVTGNLPYYISTSILTSLIEQREYVQDMVLMFQEEVAQRIIAPPSDSEYGLLSVVSQYYCHIKKGFRISRNCFKPKPEIESRVLHFTFRPESQIPFPDYMGFLIHAFSQRRKKLRNNLLRTLAVSVDVLDSIFKKMGIPENTRAENLSASQYEQLILALQPPKR
jgi:16S rRNA (adenine1518-N6/adenine1519-N6)-dimethyltransferase